MELFAAEQALGALEDRVGQDAAAALELAWYLRQADTRRAVALAADAASRGADCSAASARAALVRAEAAIHLGRLEEAGAELQAAFDGDVELAVDSRLVGALLASARGAAQRSLALADEAAALASPGSARADAAAAYAAMVSVYADPASAASRLASLGSRSSGPVAHVFASVTRSLHDFNRGDHAAVIAALEPVAAEAGRLGMLQLRLRVQNTLAAAYSNLDDKESAIFWVEASLEQARAAGWPVATGEALAFLGNFYRESGHVARALEMLQEARAALQVVPKSRGYALACCYLAHAELANGALQAAIERAREAQSAARAINATPIVVDMLTLGARALARKGDAAAGARLAGEALALAREQELGVWVVDALRALAEVHGEPGVAPPEGVPPDRAALHFLEQANEVVRSLSGHAERVSLLRELARAQERAGHLAEALQSERAAFALAQSEESRRVGNRLLAVQARHQLERQRLESEHQKRVAESEAARAAALDLANAELRAAHVELERLASTDALTGIANRRSFLAAAAEEAARSLRYGRPLGLIVADIDHFKAINDTRGHPCGDCVIRAAALALQRRCRASDRVGRIGGEEFAVLLPETDGATTLAVAEGLRSAVAAVVAEWEGEPVRFTMSFGVAALEPDAGGARDAQAALEGLVRRADAALYAAKRAGRNRVLADAPPGPLATPVAGS